MLLFNYKAKLRHKKQPDIELGQEKINVLHYQWRITGV